MPPADIEKVFNLGYSTKHGHSGLGLAIVRFIFESFGGQIGMESVPGRGTDVELIVPLLTGSAE
jgi:signal transduction histidine kinase